MNFRAWKRFQRQHSKVINPAAFVNLSITIDKSSPRAIIFAPATGSVSVSNTQFQEFANHVMMVRHEKSITNETDLRTLYPAPTERARLKTLRKLDAHCADFIARSPFLCLGTSSERGADVTPRGDQPGFVHILDDTTLAVPDWPGNNRLDSSSNIVLNPQVALLFFIPGVQETLRVNGTAEITTSNELLDRWQRNGKRPRAAIVVTIKEAFLHCGKALIRSRLWEDDYKIARAELPPYGQMLKDQIETNETAEEIQASIENGYANKLY